MPISFECDCGRKIRTADENAGRRASCPACGVQVMVPRSDGAGRPLREAEPAEEEGQGFGYNLQSEEVTPAPRRPARDDYDRDDRPRPRARRYDDADRLIRRPARSSGGGITDKGAVAGILMMVGAVVWFVVGLAVGIIFFYPPILFIIGMVCFFKGLTNRS